MQLSLYLVRHLKHIEQNKSILSTKKADNKSLINNKNQAKAKI
jgi:hypothetical protein